MKDAYMMIRCDGKVFDVPIHPYIIMEDEFRVLESGEWFYNHTLNDAVKSAFISYLAWYIKYDQKFSGDFITEFLKTLHEYSFSVSKEFIEAHAEDIKKEYVTVLKDNSDYLKILKEDSDQEFLRVRYGGFYETNFGVRDIYFRVSSTQFNWYDIIWTFVEENKAQIDTVTIVRDEISTGSAKVYKGSTGEYKRMPVEEFLTEPGNPVIEWKDRQISVRRHLQLGGNVSDIYSLPMNKENARRSYISLTEGENRNPCFWSATDLVLGEILAGKSVRKVIAENIC